jgi:drug/metabolite transporter (DMT)-like permease
LVGSLPEGLSVPTGAGTWGAVLLTAVVATAFAFVVQSWAQSQLSTARTAVVLTCEPVFAALFAWVAGESIGWSVLVGGGFVIAAMLVVEAAGALGQQSAAGTAPDQAVVGGNLMSAAAVSSATG